MTDILNIIVADDDRGERHLLRTLVETLGHKVLASCQSGQELVVACQQHQHTVDLIITDIQMDGTDGLKAAAEIYRIVQAPVIVISAHSDAQTMREFESTFAELCGYILKDQLGLENLRAAISVAIHIGRRLKKLRSDATIRRAQVILIAQAAAAGRTLSEDEAYKNICAEASPRQYSLAQIAQAIIDKDKQSS